MADSGKVRGASKCDKDLAQLIYELGARAQSLDPKNAHASGYLESCADIASSILNLGYGEDEGVLDSIKDICEKAEECNLSGAEWMQKLKKKAGLPADESDSELAMGSDDDNGGEEETS